MIARMVATSPEKEGVGGGAIGAATGDRAYAEVVAYFDAFVADEQKWRRRNSTYHRLIERVMRFHVPPGARVLEIGSGSGDLLAALKPGVGVGIDLSPGMVALARERHPQLRFDVCAGETFELAETFDYIVLSDLMPFVHDLVALFERVAAHTHPRTRVVINSYSRAWRPLIRIAERLHLKPQKPIRNWVSPHDVSNVLELSGFDTVSQAARILLPKRVPLLTTFFNGIVANVWPFTNLCLTDWIVARPEPVRHDEQAVSVICPCRNEQGHIADIVRRLTQLGAATELIFVEGGSSDDTRGEILRQIEAHPELELSLVDQPGRGKGDAVRAGFAAAEHDVLMILDGDLSVRPEDLPKFSKALASGRGELINGSRLVYDVEPGAMRFLNTLGNRAFSRLFRAVTGQEVKDTLCGTKVLSRRDYNDIAENREYFGEFDPFGDFDLLFGASRLSLKIVDLPVRYQPRSYGETNISRWRHGWLLLRMTGFAFWKFQVSPVRLGRDSR
jgi:SAM-dependent methyltransferase